MALTNTQTVAVQLEHVRPAVPVLFERSDTTFSMIEKRPVEMVSTRNARIPLASNPGGNSGAANLDGGDLGRGSADEYEFGTVTPIGMKIAVEITKLVEYATNSSQKAVANVTKKATVNAMKTFRKDIDGWVQTAGNGVIGTIESGGGTATWTLANTPFGARLLRKNMVVSVYSSNLATKRGEATINSKPITTLGDAQVVTVNADPGTSNTDVLLPSGLTGASPVWLNGIAYHHNSARTGTWQGIDRTNDFAVANGVDAGGGGFSMPPFRMAINQIIQELGEDGLSSNLTWHTHPMSLAGYEEYGLQLSTLERAGKGGEGMPDMLFNDKTMQIGGYKVKRSIHADPTRFDLMNLSSWGRVEWAPVDFLEIGGNTVFPVYGGSGGIAAAYLFYYVCGMQLFTDNPKALSTVSNVALPTGYVI
jgi:hypothetical protein